MNVSDIKQSNQNKIYTYIRENNSATKQQLAQGLDLSLPTVTKNLEYLLKMGLISSGKKDNTREGRKPVKYSYVSDAMLAIGLDITEHKIKAVVIDLQGNIITSSKTRSTFSRDERYMKLLGEIIQNLIRGSRIDADKIIGVGIAMPGLVNAEGTCVVYGRIIDNKGIDVEMMQRYIPFHCGLIHDSAASGFAENWFSPDIPSAYYLSLSNSLGGNVIINRQMYMGNQYYSSEVGHLTLVPDGRLCYCGQHGCADAYCKGDILANEADGSIGAFFEKLAEGEEKICKTWDTYLHHLAMTIINVRMMFGCPIIIGGVVGAHFRDEDMHELRKRVDLRNTFSEKSTDYLFPCRLKKESIAIGAALFYIQTYLESLYQTNPSQ